MTMPLMPSGVKLSVYKNFQIVGIVMIAGSKKEKGAEEKITPTTVAIMNGTDASRKRKCMLEEY